MEIETRHANLVSSCKCYLLKRCERMEPSTGLEPATSCVEDGIKENSLSVISILGSFDWITLQ